MKLLSLLLFSNIILVSGSFAQLKVVEYKLENGFTIILNPDETANNIFGAIAVNTGSKNDPIDATGISHYLEHLLFKGTTELGTHNYEAEKIHLDSISYYYNKLGKTKDKKQREKIQKIINYHSVEASKYTMPNEFDKLLKSIGGTKVNATTSNDLTWYFNTFPSHQINKWLDLYAHRFKEPVFRSFQSELEVVYEEKNRAMDNMQRRLFTAFNREFYKDHPYGEKSTLGTVEHLKNPSLTKMYDYYHQYYVANNMALILSGNFDVDKVKVTVEELFGTIKSGKVLKSEIKPPKPIKKSALVTTRITPVKVGILGFRTVPNRHPDELALDVIANLLQNEAGTGLVDDLENNSELMNVWAFQENGKEAGQMMFIYIPKIFVQSFKKAEKLVLDKVEILKSGKFSEEQLQAVKNDLYINHQRGLEKLNYRGYLFANMFIHGKNWKSIEDYPDRVNAITKEEIQRVAKKYFDSNYLTFHSRTGFPKKQKLNKPNFKAVQVDQSKKSSYAKRFEELEEKKFEPKFIDFNKDIKIIDLKNSSELYVVNNPINDVFNLSIKYEIGMLSNPQLEVFAKLMTYAFPKESDRKSFKQQVNLLGSTYNFEASNSYFTINITGLEKNLPKVVGMINELMQNATIEEESINAMKNYFKTSYKAEKEMPQEIMRAIAQYGIMAENSPKLRRPSFKEINRMTTKDLMPILSDINQHAVTIHFSGATKPKEVLAVIEENFSLSKKGESEIPYEPKTINRQENEIRIINNKRLLQSSIFFIENTPTFKQRQYPKMVMFNTYFGGGFSGLITQEIREYRSLAYSTAAKYQYNSHPNSNSLFYLFMSCQADKTNEAVNVAYQLVREMPQKEDQMDQIRSTVKLAQSSNYPNFRELSERVESYRLKGFEKDPNQSAYQQYDQLKFRDINEFYKRNIKTVPSFIGIYGDEKRFETKELEKIGNVRSLKLEEVITF